MVTGHEYGDFFPNSCNNHLFFLLYSPISFYIITKLEMVDISKLNCNINKSYYFSKGNLRA